MNIPIVDKKEILLSSFELLKNDFKSNGDELVEIIGKMVNLDIAIGLDMWEYLLRSNISETQNDGAYKITSRILYELGSEIDWEIIAKELKSRKFILENIMGKSANVDGNQCTLIASFLIYRFLDSATASLNYLLSNKNYSGKNHSMTIGEIFATIISDMNSNYYFGEHLIPSQAIEILFNYINELKDPIEKAKAMIKFLDIV